MDHTPNFRLNLPAFDYEPWDSDVNGNFTVLDALVNSMIGVPGFLGLWQNSKTYSIGQVLVDAQLGNMWKCYVLHTSAATPTTFAQDRLAHPTYWEQERDSASGAAEDAIQAAEDASDSAAAASGSAQDAADSAAAAADSAADAVQDVAQLRADAVLKAGSTMSGQLQLNADPQSALAAATKQYVDAAIALLASSASITVGDTPPALPKPGALWFDSVSTELFVFYNDGSSSQWVIANNVAGGAQPTQQTGTNLLHNGLFNIWQRGAGPFTSGGGYSADRWQIYTGTVADVTSVSPVALSDADRTAIGDEAAISCAQMVFTGGVAAACQVEYTQRVESVRRLAGKTITISFWARVTAGTATKLGVSIAQVFGTGGSPSGAVLGAGTPVTISSTWTRYSVTLAVPSAVGKSFGTNGDDSTQVEVWYSSSTTNATRAGNIGVQSGTVQLWGVQLEVGGGATTLMRRDPADELALCQRFYQTGVFETSAYAASPNYIGHTITLPVTMRVSPTAALTDYGSSGVTAPYVDWVNAGAMKITGQANTTGNISIKSNYKLSADL